VPQKQTSSTVSFTHEGKERATRNGLFVVASMSVKGQNPFTEGIATSCSRLEHQP